MKLVSFLNTQNEERAGFWSEGKTYDLQRSAAAISIKLPSTMAMLLAGEERLMDLARKAHDATDHVLPFGRASGSVY